MRLLLVSLVVAVLPLALAACSQASSHPPPTDGCRGAACLPGSTPPVTSDDAGIDSAPPDDAAVNDAPPD